MDRPPEDDRSAISIAYAWAVRIMTIAAMMVLPGLAGYWLDTKLGTGVVFLLGGFALGMALAIWQLMQIAKGPTGSKLYRPRKRPPHN